MEDNYLTILRWFWASLTSWALHWMASSVFPPELLLAVSNLTSPKQNSCFFPSFNSALDTTERLYTNNNGSASLPSFCFIKYHQHPPSYQSKILGDVLGSHLPLIHQQVLWASTFKMYLRTNHLSPPPLRPQSPPQVTSQTDALRLQVTYWAAFSPTLGNSYILHRPIFFFFTVILNSKWLNFSTYKYWVPCCSVLKNMQFIRLSSSHSSHDRVKCLRYLGQCGRQAVGWPTQSGIYFAWSSSVTGETDFK